MENKEKNYRVVRVNLSQKSECYELIASNEISSGNLCSIMSHEEAGDYSWGTYYFNKDLRRALSEHFGISEKEADGLVVEEDGEIYIHTYDCDIEESLELLLRENEDEIREYCNKWAEEHEILTTGKYIEYWDGSNNKHIVLWDNLNGDNETYELLGEDDEEAKRVIAEYLCSDRDNEEEKVWCKKFETEHYIYTIYYEEGWGIASVEEK